MQGPRGEIGPQGIRGAEGVEGKQGVAGDPGATDAVTRYGELTDVPTSAGSWSYAACEPGETVVGGGWNFQELPVGQAFKLVADRPSLYIHEFSQPIQVPPPVDGGKATGWMVHFVNDTGSSFEFRSYVLCASP